MKTLLLVYASQSGHTLQLADAAARGITLGEAVSQLARATLTE